MSEEVTEPTEKEISEDQKRAILETEAKRLGLQLRNVAQLIEAAVHEIGRPRVDGVDFSTLQKMDVNISESEFEAKRVPILKQYFAQLDSKKQALKDKLNELGIQVE